MSGHAYRCKISIGLVKSVTRMCLGQQRVLLLDGQVHLPRNAAIAEVAGRAGAQFGDVLRLGKIHFEQAADARCQRKQV